MFFRGIVKTATAIVLVVSGSAILHQVEAAWREFLCSPLGAEVTMALAKSRAILEQALAHIGGRGLPL